HRVPPTAWIKVRINRPQFRKVGNGNCIFETRTTLPRANYDDCECAVRRFVSCDNKGALTYRRIGCNSNPVRKARARRSIAIVIGNSQSSRFGIQASDSVKSDFDPEWYECPKCTMHSSAKGDPFLGCFGPGRWRQTQEQSGKKA